MTLRWNDPCRLCGHTAGVLARPDLRTVDVDCPHCGFLRFPDRFYKQVTHAYPASVLVEVGDRLNADGRSYTERLVLTPEWFDRIATAVAGERAGGPPRGGRSTPRVQANPGVGTGRAG